MTIVKLDTTQIKDWDTFHTVFAATFGFPDFYGRNMNAWIDCMTSLDDGGLSSIKAEPDQVVTLQLEHVVDFAKRCPEIYRAIIECSAFVNWRRVKTGEPPVLALSFHKPDTAQSS